MPKITNDRIEFLPEDRNAISEQSPGITASTYTALFNAAATQGHTPEYFKFLEEIAEKDPDILNTTDTRTSYTASKEWTVVSEDQEEGDDQTPEAEKIEEALRAIPGDQSEGLMTVDELIRSMLGDSYLIGLSFSEIVSDAEQIVGFNHVPAHFLTFEESVYYPKLWTQDKQMGVDFNQDKMISHYLIKGNDPARGYLGNALAWQYVFKRSSLDEKLRFEKKYGKGFLQVNMPGERDSFKKDWEIAEELIENLDDVDGVTFGANVEVQYHENVQSEGDYFFEAESSYKRDITKIVLGQESTSNSESSNRSTAEVHMEVLEKRILEDTSAIEDTMTSQLISKLKPLLNISEDKQFEFKFVVSELEATLDEDLEEEGAVEEQTETSQETETDTEEVETDE